MAQYTNHRPLLTIECTGSKNLGSCYNAAYFKITSPNRMKAERIMKLRAAGVLGYGQEFYITSLCDGKEQPDGTDVVPCLDEDGKPAVNAYTGLPYTDSHQPYFVYLCEDRCDSGD